MRRHKSRPNFPVPNSWIEENRMSYRSFARKAGINPQTLDQMMFKSGNPTKETVDKILAFTGMAYEVCFLEWEMKE